MTTTATQFGESRRPHILMISNHGMHDWKVLPGLPDTGGQNVFVNQFSEELARLGYRVTIANRGGYPHPRTGERRSGVDYKDAHQRVVFLEDGLASFVRKEDMHDRAPRLVDALDAFVSTDGIPVDLVISHYWDGARLGLLWNRRQDAPVKHVWVPHSLGAVKKQNVPKARWDDLRIDERIAVEFELVIYLDAIAATSSRIRQSLREDYGYTGPELFLPPCVDTNRFRPQHVSRADPLWEFLSERGHLSPTELQKRQIVTEISRTDTTKQKDILIQAFARVHSAMPETALILTIDDAQQPLATELRTLLHALDLEDATIILGAVWEWLPKVYAVTDVYCTPSIMEGFGMSAQEAAATGVPVVASDKVPFAVEYLLGATPQTHTTPGRRASIEEGEGGFVVPAGDVAGFAEALQFLLQNPERCTQMGQRAHQITAPYFTWQARVSAFLEAIEMESAHA
ncbi:MAG: glycosyltransferase [Anaerolineae bacterium]|nr:glycosyltransferase [Anaerolineae bacterium]